MGTKIYNSDLTKELREGAKIQIGVDGIPSEIAEKVVPTMEVNPKLLRNTNITISVIAVATGAQVVYTTPLDKDFYLTNAEVSMIKDVTCDQATGSLVLNCTQDGATKNLVRIPIIALTAQNFAQSINLNCPMKIDRGTNLNYTASYTAGVMARVAGIKGFTVDNINA